MRAEVQMDFDWQRALLPMVKRIVGNYLIVEAPWDEDAHHNTDLIVLTALAKRVAVRLRRQRYEASFSNEFTLRSRRPSGTETELSKVLSGWGDYIFYGFESNDPFELGAWTLGDLNAFRLWPSRELWFGRHPGELRSNADGSSEFRAYKISDLPDEFVVSRKATRVAS
ncbi:MAG: hypothetical protein WBF51_04100 [Candidatus Dormiibacterota bacterium]